MRNLLRRFSPSEGEEGKHYLLLETGNGNTPFSLSKHWIWISKPACPGFSTPETPLCKKKERRLK